MANEPRTQLPWLFIILISIGISIGSIAVFFLLHTGRCSKVEVEAWRLVLDCPPSEGNSRDNSADPVLGLDTNNTEEGSEQIQLPDLVENLDTRQQSNFGDMGSGHEELMEDEAVALVKAWLEAKPSVYGQSYDREIARSHINFPGIDAVYNNLNQLQRNDSHGPYYWKYDKPSTIDEVHRFEYFPSQGTAELVVTVSEYRTFYTRRGKSAQNSGLSTQVSKYTFGRDSNGNWKIADIE